MSNDPTVQEMFAELRERMDRLERRQLSFLEEAKIGVQGLMIHTEMLTNLREAATRQEDLMAEVVDEMRAQGDILRQLTAPLDESEDGEGDDGEWPDEAAGATAETEAARSQ